MGRFLIVSFEENLEKYKEISEKYNVGFELNDFYDPDVLTNSDRQEEIIAKYREIGLPDYYTMHGAFYDIILFSQEKEIVEISKKRMLTSMDIAEKIGAAAVVFHTNANPFLVNLPYLKNVVDRTVEFYKELLEKYSDINIYVENMFDDTPYVIKEIAEKLSGYDNFGVCFDYAHASISKTPICEWIESLKGYIKHVHINDNNLRKDLHLGLGKGKINWLEFKFYYETVFKDADILIEINQPEEQKASIEYIRNLIQSNEMSYEPDVKKRPNAEEMLENIFYCMTELMTEKKFEENLSLLNELGSSIVGAERASFWYWDKKNKKYWTFAAMGNGKMIIDEKTGIVGKCIEQDETILCNDPYSMDEFNDKVDENTGYVTKSILCIPVKNSKGEVMGAFEALNKYDSRKNHIPFEEEDSRRLSLVAAFGEKTIESYLLHQEAQSDELTGLKNRYAFYEFYNKNLSKYEDGKAAIIMCDIDHFKKINDTYGHNVGDLVLKEIAGKIRANVGEKDLSVRWGGEEFIIILMDKDEDEAYEFAENMRKTIQSYEFDTGSEKFNVTMSFGVDMINLKENAEINVKNVDDKLYKAKNTGRNRVIR